MSFAAALVLLAADGSGQPAQIDEIDVVAATLADDGRLPERRGITHWSAWFLACRAGDLVRIGGQGG